MANKSLGYVRYNYRHNKRKLTNNLTIYAVKRTTTFYFLFNNLRHSMDGFSKFSLTISKEIFYVGYSSRFLISL